MDWQEGKDRHRWRKIKSHFMSALAILSGCIVILPLAMVLFHVIAKGASSVNLNFFTKVPAPPGSPGGGMANALVGSLEMLVIATAFGAPIGVLGALYVSEYGGAKFSLAVRFMADVLNGVPSIVWGILIYAIVVVPTHSFSAWAGSLSLACMMIPLVMRTTEEVLTLVPNGYREAALALGIPRWRIILQIVARTALKGIVTGILLAVARVAGETAPLLFTAFGNLNWQSNLNQPIAALPLQIYNYAISPYDDWHRQAWAGALVLIGFVFLLNIAVRFLSRGKQT